MLIYLETKEDIHDVIDKELSKYFFIGHLQLLKLSYENRPDYEKTPTLFLLQKMDPKLNKLLI